MITFGNLEITRVERSWEAALRSTTVAVNNRGWSTEAHSFSVDTGRLASLLLS